jgi:hypothetical protein
MQYLFAMRKAACACWPGFIAVTKGFIDIVDAQRGEVIAYLIVLTGR